MAKVVTTQGYLGRTITQGCLERTLHFNLKRIYSLVDHGVLRYRGRKAYTLGWTAVESIQSNQNVAPTQDAYIRWALRQWGIYSI